MYTIDFETAEIVPGDCKSPIPVGLAVKHNDEPGEYYAFGHPSENNASFNDVREILVGIWRSGDPILCHNAKFDIRICLEWFNLAYPPIVEDTMILAFIVNPRFEKLGLKQLADLLLDMPPDEQEEMRDWIVSNVKKATPKNYGKYISEAPGDIVGKYAVGDVDRTYALYKHFRNVLKSRNELCQN